MKTAFIGQQGSNLILYFAGCTPPSAVAHLQIPPNFDLLICYDYQDLQLEFDFSCYQEIYLVVWSMGVWVAEQVLQKSESCQSTKRLRLTAHRNPTIRT